MTKIPHIGRKIGRLRELKEMKQETLAEALGVSQQAISKIEQSESIEDTQLERIAKVLGFSVEAIKSYSDEAVINNVQNNYEGANTKNEAPLLNTNCTINPLEKLNELYEENKKLYVALLKEKDEKIALLERMMKEK